MPENLGLFQSLFKNFWALLTILVLVGVSFISIYHIVERYLRFNAAKVDMKTFLNKLRKTLRKDGKFDRSAVSVAADFCRETGGTVPKVVYAALVRFPIPREEIEEAMKKTALEELSKLEKNIVIIGTIGNVAPFIGLLGTVIGVTESFSLINSMGGTGGIGVVGPGIAQALIATIVGLFVAIPSVAAYNYFARRIEEITTDITIAGMETVSLLTAKDMERAKCEEMIKDLSGYTVFDMNVKKRRIFK